MLVTCGCMACTKRSSYAHFICTSMIFILRTPNKPTTSASVVYLVNIRCHAWISLARPSRMPRATMDGVATNSTAEPSDFACWHPTDDMGSVCAKETSANFHADAARLRPSWRWSLSHDFDGVHV